MNNKLISVIIPVYNREGFLCKCIESVLSQKNVSLEIILVDDGSTDNSLAICRSYSEKYPFVKVIHQENSGIGAARNTGLDAASGDCIFFLDSDDCLQEDSLAPLLEALESHDVGYVIGNFVRVSEEGSLISESFMPTDIMNREIDEDILWKYAENEKSYLLFVTVWGKLFKKEIWNDLRFPLVRVSEDEFILPKLLKIAKSIYVTDTIVYRQTLSEVSLIRTDFNFNKLKTPESKLFIADYLINRGNYSLALQKLENSIGDAYYASLHLKDADSVHAIKNLNSRSKDLCRRLLPHTGSQKKIKLLLFLYCPALYNYLSFTLPEKKLAK